MGFYLVLPELVNWKVCTNEGCSQVGFSQFSDKETRLLI